MSDSLYDHRYAELRAFLRSTRLAAGLTQMQIADVLGVKQSHVSKLERGENFVDVLMYARWCRACNVAPGPFLEALRLP